MSLRMGSPQGLRLPQTSVPCLLPRRGVQFAALGQQAEVDHTHLPACFWQASCTLSPPTSCDL